jgi:CheY-like chemotaxis protein
MAEAPRKSPRLEYDLSGTVKAGGETPSGPMVLVVDDDNDIIRWASAVLGSRGITAVAAYDPIQGFLAARRQRPRLILVDWHMPAGGGPELLRKLREDARTAQIPVIVVTADSTPNIREEAAAFGAKHFLHKPLDADRLVEIIRQVVPEASEES